MIARAESYKQYLTEILISSCLAAIAGLFLVYISKNKSLGVTAGILFILVGLYPFVRAWRKGEFDAFEIINPFVLYMLIGIGLRGLWGIGQGTIFWFYDPASDYFDILRLKVFAYSTIALLFLYLGYYSKLGNRWLNSLPRVDFDWQDTRALICLVAYLVISMVALIFFTIRFGNWEGVSSFGLNPSAIQAQVKYGGMEHISSFIRFFWVAFYVACIYRFSKEKPIWANSMFLVCLLNAIALFLHYGGKIVVLNVLIAYIAARHYLKKRVNLKKAGAIVVGIFILSPLLWHIRNNGIYQWDVLGEAYAGAFNNPVEFLIPINARSYEFDSFALLIEAIDSGKELELGKSMASLFYFFIPRIWWPEKPLPFSVTFVPKYANMDTPGIMAPSFPGELYVNFHLIGVALGFLLLGIVMKLCYQHLIKRNHSKTSLLIYLPTFILSPFFFEGGTSKITNFLIMLFPIVVFLWFVRARK